MDTDALGESFWSTVAEAQPAASPPTPCPKVLKTWLEQTLAFLKENPPELNF